MQRKKRFTVGHQIKANNEVGYPSVRLWGKWLKDLGINSGDTLEVIEGKNMLILVKVSKFKRKDERYG